MDSNLGAYQATIKRQRRQAAERTNLWRVDAHSFRVCLPISLSNLPGDSIVHLARPCKKGTLMARTGETFSISLPVELLAEVEQITREEHCTKSELVREALQRYVEERELKSLYRYGQKKAAERGITTEEEVAELIPARRIREARTQSGVGQ